MPKSDDTRYASEIPTVLAWDPEYPSNEIDRARSIALATRQAEYDLNSVKALRHRGIIEQDLGGRQFSSVTKISWQDNFNRNNNGSPADVVFVDHPVGGISVKDGSDIIGNFGTKDFDTDIGRPRGEDLFRHLATKEFDALLYKVKSDLINDLSIGESWTEDREDDYGKYSITRTGEDLFELKFSSARKTFTREQLLTESVVSKKGVEKRMPGKWRRVFGDYYQGRKKIYKAERDALFNQLYPTIVNLCEKIIIADPEKVCQLGGFTEKPHYVSDLHNDRVYFVPPKADVMEKIKVEIFNKDKDRSFGSGFELGCKIKLIDSTESATLDFYVCYNSGTFNRGPVIKLQGFQNKEHLWQRIA